MHRETLGSRHPDTLISINNLSPRLLQAKDKLRPADKLYNWECEALAVRRETLGTRHPSTRRSMRKSEPRSLLRSARRQPMIVISR